MIQDRIEVSPLVEVSRYDPTPTPTPYTDIVREEDGKEIKRVRFYGNSEEGVVIKQEKNGL